MEEPGVSLRREIELGVICVTMKVKSKDEHPPDVGVLETVVLWVTLFSQKFNNLLFFCAEHI